MLSLAYPILFYENTTKKPSARKNIRWLSACIILFLRLTACDDGVDLALLLHLDSLLDEDVRDGDADDDGEDDGESVDAEAESLQEFFDGDGLDVQDGKEEAIEENAGDEWNDGRNDEQGVRRVDDVDDLEGGDADDGSGGK